MELFPADLTGLVFDCDGVMIDSADANRYLYNTILSALGLPILTREQELFAFQATFQQALQDLIPSELHDQIQSVSRELINYDKDILPRIRLMPGFGKFIEQAHQHGLKLAIDTNRTELGIMKVLDFFHLPSYFDPVISSTNCEPKPSPMGVLKIAAAWTTEPEQILFVGDSPDDRAAAKGAGAIFAGFGGLSGAITVTSWQELANLLWAHGNPGPGDNDDCAR